MNTDIYLRFTGDNHPLDENRRRLEQANALYVRRYTCTFPPTQSLITKFLPVIESPALTLVPCVPMGNNGVKIWLDYLFVAIFDSSALIPTTISLTFHDINPGDYLCRYYRADTLEDRLAV